MDVGASILYLVVVVVLSLIFREVVCWYWKINEYLAEFRMLATDVHIIRKSITQDQGLPHFTFAQLEAFNRAQLRQVATCFDLTPNKKEKSEDFIRRIRSAQESRGEEE